MTPGSGGAKRGTVRRSQIVFWKVEKEKMSENYWNGFTQEPEGPDQAGNGQEKQQLTEEQTGYVSGGSDPETELPEIFD